MSTKNESTGPMAVLVCPKVNKELITFAHVVHDGMLNNPSFPNPNPKLAVFAADITAFDDAETKAATKARGAAKLRDARKQQVKQDLSHLRDYVQSVVELNAGPTASALIESAFMSIRKLPNRSVPELSVKNTGVSGRVALAARAAAPAATYYWEYSLDQVNWTRIPEMMQSRTEISGLLSARVYYFRFRALTRAGWQETSQVVSLLVH